VRCPYIFDDIVGGELQECVIVETRFDLLQCALMPRNRPQRANRTVGVRSGTRKYSETVREHRKRECIL